MTIYDDALAIQQKAQDAYERVRNDASLSALGRQQKMAPALLEAKRQIDQISWSAKKHRETRVAQLKRQTFGVAASDPMAMLSHRDAVSRAADITDASHAAFHMQRALEAGDDLLARALAQSSVDHGWQGVLDQYIQARPEVGEALAEIQQLTPTIHDALNDGLYLRAPIPSELERVNDHDLEQLAATPTTTTSAPPEPATARVGGEFG